MKLTKDDLRFLRYAAIRTANENETDVPEWLRGFNVYCKLVEMDHATGTDGAEVTSV